MLNFDPRAMLAPGGVINGAGNAIAALAGVPAEYRQAQEMQRRNSLAAQALAQKGTEADREFGLKQGAQNWQMDPTNPANAHLKALDAHMQTPLTFEQQLQLAKERSGGASRPDHPYTVKVDQFGGLTRYNSETGQTETFDPYKPQSGWVQAGVGTPAAPANPAAQALAPQGAPAPAPMAPPVQPSAATQALSQPGGAPAIPGSAGKPAATPDMKTGRLKELMAKDPNAMTSADEDELRRLYKEMYGVDPLEEGDAAPGQP